MNLLVQKYGGTSVGTPERIRHVARRVLAATSNGGRVCVVVSAMGSTTDDLLGLADEVARAPHARELDMLLAAGEQISIALLSMAIGDQGGDAISLTGAQAGIRTDTAHGSAQSSRSGPAGSSKRSTPGRSSSWRDSRASRRSRR